MNRSQAKHALRMDHVEDIDDEWLSMQDEDCYVYLDWTGGVQYTVTDVGGDISISAVDFREVKRRIDAEDDAVLREYQDYKANQAVGLCPDCGQIEEECICL